DSGPPLYPGAGRPVPDRTHRRCSCGRRHRTRRIVTRRRTRRPAHSGCRGRLVIARGDIHWADLGDAEGSRPARRRPVLVIQSMSYNASRLATVVAAVITSNTALATMPGNVFLPSVVTGLKRDSVVNVTA